VNRAFIAAAGLLAKRKDELRIVCQTGERDYNEVKAAYERGEFPVEVVPFLGNMAERFAWADLIVCRAGAITAAEVAASGRAAIFIPFGRATDSHQLRNAQEMTKAGAGRVLTEPELTEERLTNEIFSLLDQPREIENMAMKARSLAYPHAARDIVDFDRRGRAASPCSIGASEPEETGKNMMVSFRNFQRIHMVGIGGIGMSGIAEVLLTLGYSVSGSDTRPSTITERLQDLGATVHEGHRAENVEGAHVVVISSAVKADNPEVGEAHKRKIPVIPRAEMLAELMRLKYGIAVGGAHGKTTTTSMVASILATAHLDPTFVVGGRVNQAGTTARVGRGEYFVVEADESDRSFLMFAPVVAVVTTIDREHLDQYSSLEDIQDAFLQFVNRVPFYGAAILCLDEPNVQALMPNVKRPIITYGTSSQADLVIGDIELLGLGSRFRLTYKGDDLGMFELPHPPGIHNVRNAAAAAAVALYLNVATDLIREGLGKFAGVGRRFDLKGVVNDIVVVDYYGHHPTEIRATLEAARGCKYNRLLVLFQPHRYTRTQQLWDEFSRAFNQADVLVLTDIYAASESPIAGVTSEALVTSIREAGHKNVQYIGSMQAAVEFLLREARPGDAIMTIGAGNVSRASNEFMVLLGTEYRVSDGLRDAH
jgi:UDP-N-acetylmuramate--alanine ligase